MSGYRKSLFVQHVVLLSLTPRRLTATYFRAPPLLTNMSHVSSIVWPSGPTTDTCHWPVSSDHSARVTRWPRWMYCSRSYFSAMPRKYLKISWPVE